MSSESSSEEGLPQYLVDLIQGRREDIYTEFDLFLKLKGPKAECFYQEALKRNVEPVELMADLIDTIIEDNLYGAILDD